MIPELEIVVREWSRLFAARAHPLCLLLALLTVLAAPAGAGDSAPFPPPPPLLSVTLFGPVTVAGGETLAPLPGGGLTVIGSETEPAVILMPGARLLDARISGRDGSTLGAAVVVRGNGGGNDTARIERCVISGGPGRGILALRGTVAVTSCLVTSSRTGIEARSASLTVESSVITQNAGPGIDLEEGAHAHVLASVIISNDAEGVRLGAGVALIAESSAITGNRGAAWRALFAETRPTWRGVLLDGVQFNDVALTVISEASDTPGIFTGSGLVAVSATQIASTTQIAFTTPIASAAPADFDVPTVGEMLMPLLDDIDFRESDLRVSTERMPFTPPAVKNALDSPLRLPRTLLAAADRYAGETTPGGFLRALAGALDARLVAPRAGAAAEGVTDAVGVTTAGSLEDSEAASLAVSGSKEALADALEEAAVLCDALPDPAGLAEAIWADEPDLTLIEEHVAEPEHRRESSRLGARAAAFDARPLLLAAASLAEASLSEAAVHEAHLLAESRSPRHSTPPPFACTGTLFASWPTSRGWIVVGGTGPNEYGPEASVILDLGGDDVYHDAACAESTVRVVVDRSGNDRYFGHSAAARRGCAILLDLGGDDVYRGGDFTSAAAQGGVALLWDENGNDRYEAARAAQGFAVAGSAALVDRSGDDEYTAASYAQAASGPAGAGFIVDAGGRDRYRLTGGASDILRDPSQRLSFGQGFSTGYRPGSAGGVALLIDATGDDVYTADLFAQGAAYWGALAAIVDGDGDDMYRAWRYAQGAGVHIAYGALIDRRGRDVYQAYSVAQGCGHDLAVGALLDGSGNDVYRSDNLSQGAGNSNGTGILLDRGGQDAYVLEGHSLGQGWGVMENLLRRYGSLGLFLDLGGDRDVYTEAGRDGATWRQGELGIGADR